MTIPIYDDDLIFIYDCEEGEMLEYVNKKFDTSFTFDGLHGVTISNDGIIIIWIEDIENEGTIVHELSHCVFTIMNSRDIKTDMNNDEPFAYLIGWLYREIKSKIVKQSKK